MNKLRLFFITLLIYSFSGVIVHAALTDEINRYIHDEYNKNINTVQDLINYTAQKDQILSNNLKHFYEQQKISPNSTLPRLTYEKNYLAINIESPSKIKLFPSKKGILVQYKSNKELFHFTISPEQAKQKIDKIVSSKISFQVITLLLNDAKAEGVDEAAGIAGSGIMTGVIFGTLGVLESVGKFFKDLSSIPNRMSEKSIRGDATEACQKIKNNKPVTGIDKIRDRLIALKDKVNCVPFWESYMEYSCGWFDERIACLSTGSVMINDKDRHSPNKIPSETTNQSSSVPSAISR